MTKEESNEPVSENPKGENEPAAKDTMESAETSSKSSANFDLDDFDLKGESDWQITWRQYRKNWIGMFSLFVVYALFALAIFAPLLASELPLYMRGVITVFFDSDVTAWRDLSGKVLKLNKSIKMLENDADSDSGTLGLLRQKRLLAIKQTVELLDRIEETLPDSDSENFRKLRSTFASEFKAKPAVFDTSKLVKAQDELDDFLCDFSYLLIYKKATSLAIDLEQRSLSQLPTLQEDFIYATDDEDEEQIAELTKNYQKTVTEAAAVWQRLSGRYAAMSPFLGLEDSQTLASLRKSAGQAMAALPAKPGEDDSDLVDAIDNFKSATESIDTKLSQVGIDASKQRLPSREFYPVFKHLSAAELFFMLLYTILTLCLLAVFAGAFPNPSPSKVMKFAFFPALVLSLFWWITVPTKNPPPANYYKRFYESVKEGKRRYKLSLERKRATADSKIQLTDPGEIVLAPFPFGENENITIDAKVPPTWAENNTTKRRRLLSRAEKKADKTVFQIPATWDVLNHLDASIDHPSPFRGAGTYRLPSRFPKEGDATVRVFSLKTGGKIPSIAKTAKQFNAWFDSDILSIPSFGDTKVSRLSPRGIERLINPNTGTANYLSFRGATTTRVLIRLEWTKGEAPADGPWGIELIGGNRTVDSQLMTFIQFVESVTHTQESLIANRLEESINYHWLGTDENGRDIAARMVYGSRVSLSVGFVAVGIYVLLGVIFGSLAGFFGGWIDMLISRFIEVVICFPSFFLIITVLAMFPPSIFNIMFVIGITRWTGVARLIRGEFLRLVKLDFVVACKALGLTPTRTIFRHIVPNAIAPVLVAATFGVAGAILTESALSFLGFGVPQPQASWGSILQESRADPRQLWWITVFPGLAIFITITAYNIVGEAFRDASDPKLRK